VWSTVNNTLGTDDVTIYVSALKASGTTQQSQGWFINVQRTVPGPHRLTLDGHSFYNANTSTPSWQSNPTPISQAYTNGQVFKLTGNGSMALGWTRVDGASTVTVGGTSYTCIRTHIASSDNQPGSGPNWTKYWDAHGSGSSSWASGSTYYTRVAQDYVTLHGFETSGDGARAGFLGNNLVVEYLYSHDSVSIGAQVTILYTTYPDSTSAQIIAGPSTNIVFGNIKVKNTNGEGLYIGAINPDSSAAQQEAMGNQIYGLTITNFWIEQTGVGSGQGDGIDHKNGIVNELIRHGYIGPGFNRMGGIIVSQTHTPSVSQNLLIEDVEITGTCPTGSGGSSEGEAIYMNSSTFSDGSAGKGYNGVTIRNCRLNNNNIGIYCVNGGGSINNIVMDNNSVRNSTNSPGITLSAQDTVSELKNNALWMNNQGGDQASMSSGVVSANNAYGGGTWSGSGGKVTGAVDSDFVNAAAGDFHLASPSAREVDAGITISSFSTDADGVARPQGAAWDIGAYEYPSGGAQVPLLSVSPLSLNFGTITVGTTADQTFTVKNGGAGTLSGTATVSAPFSIVSGGSYSLGAGQTQVITVRFSPNSGGTNSQTVTFTGGGGGSATVTGVASSSAPTAPTVSPIAQTGADVDPNAPGVQIYAGSVVQYSGSASDPNGLPLTWQWIYTINGGSEVVLQSGSGAVTSVSYNYSASTAGNTYVWKLRVSNGQATSESDLTVGVEAPPPPANGLTIQASAGTISSPFVLTNGYLLQPVDTIGIGGNGRATFSFTLTNSGSWIIQASVNAPNIATKSFYINIDADPVDPTMIWDIPVTSGFEQRVVSWRGNGAWNSDQFVPKVFDLSAGTHQLVLLGREANTEFASFSLLLVPQPPQNLHIIAGP
jgi:hypothetical protein